MGFLRIHWLLCTLLIMHESKVWMIYYFNSTRQLNENPFQSTMKLKPLLIWDGGYEESPFHSIMWTSSIHKWVPKACWCDSTQLYDIKQKYDHHVTKEHSTAPKFTCPRQEEYHSRKINEKNPLTVHLNFKPMLPRITSLSLRCLGTTPSAARQENWY